MRRLAAFVPLALFGMLHWTALVRPSAGWEGFAAVAAAGGAALVLLGLRGVDDGRRRAAALGLVTIALLVVGFRTAGVPARVLLPWNWDELASGLVTGISAMPGVTVPYRGLEPWVRSAILVGGTLLAGLAALLAFWPAGRRMPASPLPAAVALAVLYAVPVIEHGTQAPWLGGAVFTLLVAAFLWLERLPAEQLGVASLCLLAATLVALVVAPRLDQNRPWIDYQGLAEDLQPKSASTFSWNHGYGPLGWPRDGKEVLRVKAPTGAYWKAVSLDVFDGLRWKAGRLSWLMRPDTQLNTARRDWFQTLKVSIRGMRSREFIGAGTTLEILPPAPNAERTSYGTWQTQQGVLSRGTTYEARAYIPNPTETEMRTATGKYPDGLRDFLKIELPQPVVHEAIIDPGVFQQPAVATATLTMPWFAEPAGAPISTTYASGYTDDRGNELLARSSYAKVYRIAQRLRSRVNTPYQYVTAVRDRVQHNAVYTESPSPHRVPLAAFLTSDPAGYCQQFSGAMALLLRMGGVPARVASGFSTGSYDRKTGEYVVRDLDAHSWVEVYFPGIGWTKWDPTPSAAPARRDSTARAAGAPAFSGAGTTNGDRASDAGGPGARAAAGGTGLATLMVVGALVALGLVAGGWTLVRRGRIPGGALAPELEELQRALHRSGRTPPPNTTLVRLETIVGTSAAARDYLRALRRARYGAPAPDAGPTAAQRRALRDELAAGLGLRGRLRALWALPPRPGEWPLLRRLRRS